MQSENKQRHWIAYAPGLVLTFTGLAVTLNEGGWLSVAIVAVALVPPLLIAYILNFLLFRKYSPASKYSAFGIGLLIYVLSTGVILILLNEFGPSQIM